MTAMGVSKVEFDGRTIIDLTSDTVTEDNLLDGATAHDAAGNQIVGKAASISNIINAIYPVGAVYLSVTNTSPAALFGGTWEQIKDVFLLAAGDIYSAGTTGGEANHTLTLGEMPTHDHGYNAWNEYISTLPPQETSKNTISVLWENHWLPAGDLLVANGHGQPHNNMPPYLTIYMWKRIA